MRPIAISLALGAGLALAACSKDPAEPSPEGSEPVGSPVPAASSPADVPASAQSAAPAAPAASPTPTATATAPITAIPAAVRGRWGLVPADCTSKLGDAKGLLTISADQLKFYESVAKMGAVKEGDESRIRATFRYSGEGQAWTQDVVLDVQDGGKTLIRRDYGPDALPGPFKYTRCR